MEIKNKHFIFNNSRVGSCKFKKVTLILLQLAFSLTVVQSGEVLNIFRPIIQNYILAKVGTEVFAPRNHLFIALRDPLLPHIDRKGACTSMAIVDWFNVFCRSPGVFGKASIDIA